MLHPTIITNSIQPHRKTNALLHVSVTVSVCVCMCVLLWAGERLKSLFGSRSVLIKGQSLTESTPCFSDWGVSGGLSGLSRDRKSAGHTFPNLIYPQVIGVHTSKVVLIKSKMNNNILNAFKGIVLNSRIVYSASCHTRLLFIFERQMETFLTKPERFLSLLWKSISPKLSRFKKFIKKL